MNHQNILKEEKIGKLLAKFSIPCILSLLISALYNIVDQIFIGNSKVGFLGNSATTIVYPITVIVLAFSLFYGDGCAAHLSISQGKKDTKESHKSVGNMLLMLVTSSFLIILIVSLFMEQILTTFGATSQSISLSMDYCRIILFGIPFYMIGNSLGAVIRSDGNPKVAMLSMLSGAIVNIILDPIFIFSFDLGIKGAAYATILGQFVCFLICIFYLFHTKTFRLKINSFIPNFSLMFTLMKLGVSSFLTQISIVIMSIVTNIVLKKYGAVSIYGSDIAVAVYGIVTKIYGIVISIVIGIAVGGQPIIGYNYGAGEIGRVKKTYRYILVLTFLVSLVFSIIFITLPKQVISIFGSGNELYMDFGVKMMRIYLMLLIFTCLTKVSSIFLQSIGNPIKSAILSLTRDIVLLVPLTLILPLFMNIEGVLWAAPISDIFSIIITFALVYLELKKLSKLDK